MTEVTWLRSYGGALPHGRVLLGGTQEHEPDAAIEAWRLAEELAGERLQRRYLQSTMMYYRDEVVQIIFYPVWIDESAPTPSLQHSLPLLYTG